MIRVSSRLLAAVAIGLVAVIPAEAGQGRGGGGGGGSTPPPLPPAPVTVVNPAAGDCYSGAGCLDPAFGALGRVQADVGGAIQHMNLIAIQPDGKIVAVGSRNTSPCCAASDMSLMVGRFLPDGSIDATFGVGGLVTVNLIAGNSLEFIVGLALQSDGKVVVAGSASVSGGGSERFNAVTRLTASGVLDPTFGSGGMVSISSNSSTSGGVIVQPDGKIVVALQDLTNYTRVTRLLTNGSPDKKFGSQGARLISDFTPHAVALQSTGRIVVAGRRVSSADGALTRLTSSGAVDTSFGTDGTTVVDFGGSQSDTFLDVSVAPDDSIAAGGITNPSGSLPLMNGALARFTANGALNNAFGSFGRVILDMHNGWDHIRTVNLRSDGRIEFAGFAGTSTTAGFPVNVVVGRVTSTGALDSSFGAGGVTETATGAISSQAMAIAIGPDGLLTVAGHVFNITKDGPDRWLIARYFR